MKKVAIIVACLFAIAGGVGYYLWTEATALPDWYTAEASGDGGAPAVEPVHDHPRALRGELADPPPIMWTPLGPPPPPADASDDGAKTKPKQPGSEVRNFHLRSTAKNPALRKAVRGSRATYEDGVLEAGVILNLSKIERKALSANDRKTFDRAMRSFPTVARRDVYVGLRDRTVTRDGILQLGPTTKIRIGELDYSLNTVAKRLGLSTASIRRQINRELRRLKVRDPEATASAEEG